MLFEQFKRDMVRCMFLENQSGMYSEVLKNCSNLKSKTYCPKKHDLVLNHLKSINEDLYNLKRKWFRDRDLEDI